MSKINRRQQILESLALMLQERPGNRITTASLAAQVGVSEAALYRHFPSKGKMLEGLIVFAEETLFSRITLILDDHDDASARCRNIIFLLLSFIERNPGFARLFVGDALQGETERPASPHPSAAQSTRNAATTDHQRAQCSSYAAAYAADQSGGQPASMFCRRAHSTICTLRFYGFTHPRLGNAMDYAQPHHIRVALSRVSAASCPYNFL